MWPSSIPRSMADDRAQWTQDSINNWSSVQAALHQNMPHEQVDWAALAKCWIEMQHDANKHEEPAPSKNVISNVIDQSPFAVYQTQNSQQLQNEVNTWGHHISPHTFHHLPPRAMPHSFDGNIRIPPPFMIGNLTHVSRISPNFNCPPPLHQPPPPPVFWNRPQAQQRPVVQTPPMIKSKPATTSRSSSNHHHNTNSGTYHSKSYNTVPNIPPTTPEVSSAEALKRKQLPIWIREGLEKMEREKQKRIEKEREEEVALEMLRLRKIEEEALRKEIEMEQQLNKTNNSPSADASLQSDEDEAVETTLEKGHDQLDTSLTQPYHDPEPEPLILTEEEKLEEIMLCVRKALTEILLGVTNAEIASIAKEVILKEKSKRAVNQLAIATPIKSSSGLGGLISGYGSDSDSENDDSRQGSDDLLKNETYDSDEELRKRIREKRRNFAITEKEITANHETAVDSGKASIIEVQDIEPKNSSSNQNKLRSTSTNTSHVSRSRSRSIDRNYKHNKSYSRRHRSRSRSKDKSRRKSRSRSKSRGKRRHDSRNQERKSKRRSRSKSREKKSKRHKSRSRSRSRNRVNKNDRK